MKLIATLAASICAQDIAIGAHFGGCLFPDDATKVTIASDPNAQFNLVSGTYTETGAYAEGSVLSRECAVECQYDGSDTTCTYGTSDESYVCFAKEGKGVRKGNTYFIFASTADTKPVPKAVFFKGGDYDKWRVVGKKLLCPTPVVSVSDPDAVCGPRPSIPSKQLKFNQFTAYTDDLSSVECLPNGIPKAKNAPKLNLVCAEKKAGNGFEWLSSEENKKGKVQLKDPTVGNNNKLKEKYLCKFNKNYDPTEGSSEGSGEGSGSEGSGANLIEDAEVSI